MTIQTERLTLRPFAMRDLKTTHAYASDPENTPYMMSFPSKAKWETRRFLKKVTAAWKKKAQRIYEFAVEFDGAHIGSAGIFLSEDRHSGSLGWIIRKEYQGRGYATEAARAVMEFARGLGVTAFSARCDARNAASRRVMEKLGMALESQTTGRGRYKHGPEEEATELKYTLNL
ncbi:MAG: GNAT family N-acetyltransferase [Oscillospiraceae bacterium]|jgi:RimJ/RimL family protein N-acetyltransferase|nr:GNAT family N-acetyltransferase [Oscillospiraceae bacterium]